MEQKHSEIMISKLLEENKLLKKKIHNLENNKFNKTILFEKIKIIRLIFSTFENCKDVYDTSSIILFGSFLKNLLFRKPIKNEPLQFYYSHFPQIINTTPTVTKFYNIISNIDYFENSFSTNSHVLYNIKKNGIKFQIIFYNNRPYKSTFFDIQGIELDSFYGFRTYFCETRMLNHVIHKKTGILDILKSNYLNEANNYYHELPQEYLLQFINTQNQLKEEGYNVKHGIKTIELSEPCSICYENHKEGMFLKCTHVFCTNCIKTHLKINPDRSKKCPLCRSDLNIVFD